MPLVMPLFVAAGGDGGSDQLTKCIKHWSNKLHKMQTNGELKGVWRQLVGKEEQLCSCVVDKVGGDTSLKKGDQEAILISFETETGSEVWTEAATRIRKAGIEKSGARDRDVGTCMCEVLTKK